jgi:hypothetical protein
VDDRALTDLQQMLHGRGSSAFSAAAAMMTWPLLIAWAAWKRLKNRRRRRDQASPLTITNSPGMT